MPRLDQLYAAYSDRIEFLFVYVTEAHPRSADQRSTDPRTIEDRVGFACRRMNEDPAMQNFAVPIIVDGMDNSTRLAYIGFPARSVLVGRDGRVAWAGAAGPAGIRRPANTGEMEDALKRELAKEPPTQQELRAVAEEEAGELALFYGSPAEGAVPLGFINCGAAEDYTDKAGRLWRKDQAFGAAGHGYVGGKPIASRPHWVAGTKDWPVYTSAVEGMTAYRIPVKNGAHIVRLHFAEIDEDRRGRRSRGAGDVQPGKRVFTVRLEGEPVLPDFGIFPAARHRRYASVIRTFAVDVVDGEITIEFAQENPPSGDGGRPPLINAIEVWRKP